MKNREWILIDFKKTSVILCFSPCTWGLGWHFYYNIWLTIYFYVGPIWIHVTFYRIHRY